MGMFARYAQAINLLEQVLKHVSEANMMGHSISRSERGRQLDRTIRSLVNLTQSESHFRKTDACLQTSTCYRYWSPGRCVEVYYMTEHYNSALMTLHDLNLLGDPIAPLDGSLESQSLTIRKALSADVVDVVNLFVHRVKTKERYLAQTSPLVVNWVYQAASTYARLYLMTEDEQYLEYWKILDESFQLVGQRWRLAGKLSLKRPFCVA